MELKFIILKVIKLFKIVKILSIIKIFIAVKGFSIFKSINLLKLIFKIFVKFVFKDIVVVNSFVNEYIRILDEFILEVYVKL